MYRFLDRPFKEKVCFSEKRAKVGLQKSLKAGEVWALRLARR